MIKLNLKEITPGVKEPEGEAAFLQVKRWILYPQVVKGPQALKFGLRGSSSRHPSETNKKFFQEEGIYSSSWTSNYSYK